ncbi:hypothetical protein MBLNU13_g04074t2 [Cladosporium sp. NU13]
MASNAQTTPDTSHSTMSITQRQEANILHIPNTTDEAAINDAVFDFCESFHADGRYEFPERVNRLNFLFRAYSDDEELFDPDTYADFQEARNRRLSREITKYHGVRSLISELAFRKSGVCDNSARVILE